MSNVELLPIGVLLSWNMKVSRVNTQTAGLDLGIENKTAPEVGPVSGGKKATREPARLV